MGRVLKGCCRQRSETVPKSQACSSEADAAAERVVPAGALPDPKFSMELRDITRMGRAQPDAAARACGQHAIPAPQELPWFGKRGLKRESAQLQAEAARGRVAGTWSELATKIKTTYAQLYYLDQNERLTREIPDLMTRLEKSPRCYAGGLAAQQDVIRAQLEQTTMRNELVHSETERSRLP